jgi:glycerate dehydrogenase
MNIVVLDGFAMNPGDLSWEDLETLGDCRFYDRTPADQVAQRAREAHVAVLNKVLLDATLIASLPVLKFISVLATGYDNVDVAAARENGIPVSNVPAYSTPSVAQAVFAHLLNLTLPVAHHARTVRRGRWFEAPDYCYWETPLVELAGSTLGIVGWGNIGQATAGLARAFGMSVLVATRTPPLSLPPGCALAEMDALFRCADVVSLHCPLTPETERLVNTERLALMKSSAYLINTGRGGLIDETALAAALREGRLAGAGLDVLSQEPPLPDNPLIGAPHCHITPHLAWATRASRQRLLDVTVANVRAFIAGHPRNVVNGA